jgi:hypothetical protein
LRTLQEPANGLLNPCVVLLGFAAKWKQTVQAPAGACKLGRSVMKAKRNFDKSRIVGCGGFGMFVPRDAPRRSRGGGEAPLRRVLAGGVRVPPRWRRYRACATTTSVGRSMPTSSRGGHWERVGLDVACACVNEWLDAMARPTAQQV